jgi:hypothetical protein
MDSTVPYMSEFKCPRPDFDGTEMPGSICLPPARFPRSQAIEGLHVRQKKLGAEPLLYPWLRALTGMFNGRKEGRRLERAIFGPYRQPFPI